MSNTSRIAFLNLDLLLLLSHFPILSKPDLLYLEIILFILNQISSFLT